MQATSNRRDTAPLFLWETLEILPAMSDLGPDIRIKQSFVSEIEAIFLPFMPTYTARDLRRPERRFGLS